MPTTRTFTFSQVVLIVVLAMALIFGGYVIGQSSAANAGPAPQTYYACVKAGKLTKVGTTQPTCKGSRNKLISWNQTGPAGQDGAAGQAGPAGQAGAGMNYLAGTADLSSSSTVSFTTALGDTNYSVTVTPQTSNPVSCQASNKTTGGFDVACQSVTQDFERAHVCVSVAPSLLGDGCGYTDYFAMARSAPWSGTVSWIVVPNKNS